MLARLSTVHYLNCAWKWEKMVIMADVGKASVAMCNVTTELPAAILEKTSRYTHLLDLYVDMKVNQSRGEKRECTCTLCLLEWVSFCCAQDNLPNSPVAYPTPVEIRRRNRTTVICLSVEVHVMWRRVRRRNNRTRSLSIYNSSTRLKSLRFSGSGRAP